MLATVADDSLDLTGADLRPVLQIAREMTGRRPSPATTWRWCKRGTAGRGRLPAVQLYGCWHTSPEAWRAWLRGEFAPAVATEVQADDAALSAAGLL